MLEVLRIMKIKALDFAYNNTIDGNNIVDDDNMIEMII